MRRLVRKDKYKIGNYVGKNTDYYVFFFAAF